MNNINYIFPLDMLNYFLKKSKNVIKMDDNKIYENDYSIFYEIESYYP